MGRSRCEQRWCVALFVLPIIFVVVALGCFTAFGVLQERVDGGHFELAEVSDGVLTHASGTCVKYSVYFEERSNCTQAVGDLVVETRHEVRKGAVPQLLSYCDDPTGGKEIDWTRPRGSALRLVRRGMLHIPDAEFKPGYGLDKFRFVNRRLPLWVADECRIEAAESASQVVLVAGVVFLALAAVLLLCLLLLCLRLCCCCRCCCRDLDGDRRSRRGARDHPQPAGDEEVWWPAQLPPPADAGKARRGEARGGCWPSRAPTRRHDDAYYAQRYGGAQGGPAGGGGGWPEGPRRWSAPVDADRGDGAAGPPGRAHAAYEDGARGATPGRQEQAGKPQSKEQMGESPTVSRPVARKGTRPGEGHICDHWRDDINGGLGICMICGSLPGEGPQGPWRRDTAAGGAGPGVVICPPAGPSRASAASAAPLADGGGGGGLRPSTPAASRRGGSGSTARVVVVSSVVEKMSMPPWYSPQVSARDSAPSGTPAAPAGQYIGVPINRE